MAPAATLEETKRVSEAEDASGERAIPEQVVERGEKHGGGRPRRVQVGAGGHEHLRAAVLHAKPFERSLANERVNLRPDPRGPALQAPVLDDPRLGQRASCAHGAHGQLT